MRYKVNEFLRRMISGRRYYMVRCKDADLNGVRAWEFRGREGYICMVWHDEIVTILQD